MRIITWNCAGAFRNKFTQLSDYEADIYVIQECEDPNSTAHSIYKSFSENSVWIGDNKNKGIGVFAKPEINLKKLNWDNTFKNHQVKYFLPISINNDFTLLNVWAHSNKSPTFGYIGQFWKYLKINKQHFNEILITGDFNSNVIWDKWDRWWNHSDVVNELNELGIYSVYHNKYEEEQGKEMTPTFYLQKNLNKPYHIDHTFSSKCSKFKILDYRIEQDPKWLQYSDHRPILIDLEQ